MNKLLQGTGGSLFDPRELLKLVVNRLIFRLTFGGPVGEEEENGLMNIFEQARKFQKEANVGVLADFMPWLRFALKGHVAKVCRNELSFQHPNSFCCLGLALISVLCIKKLCIYT